MRKNLFIKLSNQELQDCFQSYIRVQVKRENSKENEMFSNYINEYIWMLEKERENYRYYDDNKKYNLGFAIAEKDMLYDMAKRYLKLYKMLKETQLFLEA
jgi:hypothetical protein